MGSEAPGSARLVLADNVVHLDPVPAVFEAMLEGWRQQQSARFLKTSMTIAPRLRLIRRLWEFTGLYPWQWTPTDGEAFIDDMRGGESPIVASTARTYEVAISLFLEYLLDSRYGWVQVCEERFGDTPQQVFHEGNSVLHKLDSEGDLRRRPLTYDEVQALFDAADARPSTISGLGRKGALCAARDAAVLKTVYAFGLRRRQTSRVDMTDLRRNRKAPQFGNFGSVMVWYGKAPKGSPPKRRTVLLVPEMDWVADTLTDWVSQMRPRFSPGSPAARLPAGAGPTPAPAGHRRPPGHRTRVLDLRQFRSRAGVPHPGRSVLQLVQTQNNSAALRSLRAGGRRGHPAAGRTDLPTVLRGRRGPVRGLCRVRASSSAGQTTRRRYRLVRVLRSQTYPPMHPVP